MLPTSCPHLTPSLVPPWPDVPLPTTAPWQPASATEPVHACAYGALCGAHGLSLPDLETLGGAVTRCNGVTRESINGVLWA